MNTIKIFQVSIQAARPDTLGFTGYFIHQLPTNDELVSAIEIERDRYLAGAQSAADNDDDGDGYHEDLANGKAADMRLLIEAVLHAPVLIPEPLIFVITVAGVQIGTIGVEPLDAFYGCGETPAPRLYKPRTKAKSKRRATT